MMARLRASEAGRIAECSRCATRMASVPFAFLRGNAWVMAPDLAALPVTGYRVQICGDAHVRNLGAYAAQDGRVVFDVNDFDETCRAPLEWELTRLATSIVVVAREGGRPTARRAMPCARWCACGERRSSSSRGCRWSSSRATACTASIATMRSARCSAMRSA